MSYAYIIHLEKLWFVVSNTKKARFFIYVEEAVNIPSNGVMHSRTHSYLNNVNGSQVTLKSQTMLIVF